MKEKLPYKFYDQSCLDLAENLLGKLLVHKVDGKRLAGYIVETEAYLGVTDGASHTYNFKKTPRTEAMFMSPGTSYVYSIYGKYVCFNVKSKEEGSAVLIRALEPSEGISVMAANRNKNQAKTVKEKDLCSGPSKLCQALMITKIECNKLDLPTSDVFWVEDTGRLVDSVVRTTRIGIDSTGPEWTCKPWRFYVLGNKNVSVRNKTAEKEQFPTI